MTEEITEEELSEDLREIKCLDCRKKCFIKRFYLIDIPTEFEY